MPHFVSAQTVERVLAWDETIARLRHAYSLPHTETASPPRTLARGQGNWLRTLTAVPPGSRYMGAKLFGVGRQRSLEYVVVLIDQETGQIAGFVDANPITKFRTAATSAVAIEKLAKPSPLRVGLLGSGDEAQSHLRALARVRTLDSVKIFSPTKARRESFATTFSAELGIPCTAVGSAEETTKEADIIVAAARARDEKPILDGGMLKPGMLVVSIGSTLPEQREIDSSVVDRCDLIVCDMIEEVVHETGDMIAAAQDKVAFEHKLLSLNKLMTASSPPRTELPLFKSVGAALQDLVVAELAFEKALAQGLATPLPIEFLTKGRGLRQMQEQHKRP